MSLVRLLFTGNASEFYKFFDGEFLFLISFSRLFVFGVMLTWFGRHGEVLRLVGRKVAFDGIP